MVRSESVDTFTSSVDVQPPVITASLCADEKECIPEEGLQDSSSRSSSLSTLPTPPDGGWGWMVCFSSFMCNAIIDGFMFSFGVFFVDLLDYFKESKGKTAWAGSILMGMSMFSGPITSSLVNVFGTRAVTIFGAIFASASFACSTLSPNVDVLILLYGVCGGIGLSFMFISAVLSVGFYFEKKRAFANGIAACGAGVGIFTFAQLSRFLLDVYAWRGALLINSGLVLNCAVFGALFRPLRKAPKKKIPGNSSSDKLLQNEEAADVAGNKDKDGISEASFTPKVLIKNGKLAVNEAARFQHGNQKSSVYTASMPNIDNCQPKLTASDKNLYEGKAMSRNLHMKQGHMHCYEDNQYVGSLTSFPDMRNRRIRTISCESRGGAAKSSKKSVISSPLYRKDAFYSGSIASLQEFRSNPDLRSYRKSMMTLNTNTDSGMESSACSPKEVLRFLYQMCDLSLLTNPVFIIIIISCTLWTAQSVVMTYIGDYAITQGLSKQKAAHLLAIIGITNTIGRAVIGWFCDRPFVDCVVVNMLALLIAAGLNCAIPYITTFEPLAALCAVYGLCMGTWVSLRPIVLVSLLGIDKLTNAFGWLAMFQGVGFIVGPPIAGSLYDYTQTYNMVFLGNGVIFAVAGILCLPLRRLVAHLRKLELRKEQAEFADDP